MKVELVDCQNFILKEISDKRFKRKDVALSYYFCMVSSEKVNWQIINRAIIDRWSWYALDFIKTLAWKKIDRPYRLTVMK